MMESNNGWLETPQMKRSHNISIQYTRKPSLDAKEMLEQDAINRLNDIFDETTQLENNVNKHGNSMLKDLSQKELFMASHSPHNDKNKINLKLPKLKGVLESLKIHETSCNAYFQNISNQLQTTKNHKHTRRSKNSSQIISKNKIFEKNKSSLNINSEAS